MYAIRSYYGMSALIQFPITRQVNTERDSAMQNYKQGFAVFTRSLLHAEWAQRNNFV